MIHPLTKHLSILACLFLVTTLNSCIRAPGEGGKASIIGLVDMERRNQINNANSIVDTIPAADLDVFIVYGENTSPDDKVVTNPDGEFSFNWLRTGEYTIYVYSEDTSSGPDPMPLPKIAISQQILLEDRDQTIEADPFLIYDEY